MRRAVRRGVAVHDPREAPYAAAYAELVAGRSQPIPMGLPVAAALLIGGIVAVAAGAARPIYLVPLLAAVLVRPLQRRRIARAHAAAGANRELALHTGVALLEYEPPTPAWHEVTPWTVAALIAVVVGIHLGLAATTDPIDTALPPPMAEPTPVAASPGWYALARKECARAVHASRDVRNAAVDKIWNSGPPGEANGALMHLGAAMRAEEKGDRRLAKSEAKIAGFLFEELGLPSCARAFG